MHAEHDPAVGRTADLVAALKIVDEGTPRAPFRGREGRDVPQLTTQFAEALRGIEPTGEDKTNAPAAHGEVRDALLADETLANWGLNHVLIGSYRRHVSIRRMKDVDVFGRLSELPKEVEPDALLKEFERVLKDTFGNERVARQARSLQVPAEARARRAQVVMAR